MALNFPTNPTVNQTYTAEGRTFVWNGSFWLLRRVPFTFATDAEALAGTVSNRPVSPASTRVVTNTIPPGGSAHPFSGTPTDVSASRSRDVNYQNPFDRPMLIAVWGATAVILDIGASNPANIRISNNINQDIGQPQYLLGLIPPRWWYRLGFNASTTFTNWVEYR